MKTPRTLVSNESLEDRLVPANYSIATYFELVAALQDANSNNEDDTVTLTSDIAFNPNLPEPEGLLLGEANTLTEIRSDTPSGRKIDGLQLGRLFRVSAGTVSFENLQLTGGYVFAASDVPARGGAVLIDETATAFFSGVTLTNNIAQGGRIGLGSDAAGGAVFVAGALNAVKTVFDGNMAGSGETFSGFATARGGAISGSGSIVLDSSVFQNNQAIGAPASSNAFGANGGFAYGGAIDSTGNLTLTASLVGESNAAIGGKGGNSNDGFGGSGGDARGGGVYIGGASMALIGNSTIAGNSAIAGLGGIGSAGNGDDGKAGAGGIEISPYSIVTIASTTVARNLSPGVGLSFSSYLTLFNDLLAQNFGGNLVGDPLGQVVEALGNYFESMPPYFISTTENTVGGQFLLPPSLETNGTLAIDPAGQYFRRTYALLPLPSGRANPAVGIGDVSKLTESFLGPNPQQDGRGNSPRISSGRTDAGSFQSDIDTALPSSFRFDGLPATVTAGTAFAVTLTVLDTNNIPFTTYTGPATLTATDGGSTSVTFVNGVGTATVTITKSGPATLTVTDDSVPSLFATAPIGVRPVALQLTVTAIQQLGTPFPLTITALDRVNPATVSTGFSGSVSLTPASGFLNPVPLLNGTATVNAILQTVGSTTFTVTDGTLTATATVDVRGIGFRLSAPANPRANTSFDVTITAIDGNGDPNPAFAGAVTLSLGANTVSVPATAFVQGVAIASIAAATSGPAAIVVTDAATGLVGTLAIAVLPSALAIAPLGPVLSGQSFAVVVTAVDGTTYAGSGTLSIGSEVLPLIFQNGRATVSLTRAQAADLALRADADGLTAAGTLTILPARFVLNAPPTVFANAPFDVIVTAVNADNSTATAYHRTTSPALTFTNGVATLPQLVSEIGPRIIRVTDGEITELTGQTTVDLQSDQVASYQISATGEFVVGKNIRLRINAFDALGRELSRNPDHQVRVIATTTTGMVFEIGTQVFSTSVIEFPFTPTEPGRVTITVIGDVTTTATFDVVPFTVASRYQPLGSQILPDQPNSQQLTSGRYYTSDGVVGDEPAVAGFGEPLTISVLQVNPAHVSRYGLPYNSFQEGPSSRFTPNEFRAASLSHYSTESTGGRSPNQDGTVPNDFIATNPATGDVTLVYDGPEYTYPCYGDINGIAPRQTRSGANVGGTPVAATTLNTDSLFPDVIVANSSGGLLNRIRNRGDGSQYFGPATRFPANDPFAPVFEYIPPPIDQLGQQVGIHQHFSYTEDDNIPTGGQPVGVLGAPLFRGQSLDDLIVANAADNSVLILHQAANGSFVPLTPLRLPTGYQPRRMVSADFDDDGNPDLAVAAFDPATSQGLVAVFYGDGQGSFSAPQSYAALGGNGSFAERPVDLLAVDVNGDGRKDLLVVGNREGNLGVLLHDDLNMRSFSAVRRYALGQSFGDFGYYPTSVEGLASGDYNADGQPDVAVLGDVGGVHQVIIFHSVPVTGALRDA